VRKPRKVGEKEKKGGRFSKNKEAKV